MLTPRPYQEEAVKVIRHDLLTNCRSTMMIAATGVGKTICFALLCQGWPRELGRILILAHRKELVRQAYRTCKRACPDDHVDIEMQGYRAVHERTLFDTEPSRIVVASKDTLFRQKRLANYKPESFGLVIVDEAQHCIKRNKTYYNIIKHFNKAKILGVTAAADRLDKEAMGGIFERVSYRYDILQAVTESWLVPIRQQIITVEDLDFSFIKTMPDGDLDPEELDRIMKVESVIHALTWPVIELTREKRLKTLLFATSVDQARLMAKIINRTVPGQAVALAGDDDPEVREQQLERFKKKEFQYLCNCNLYIEGLDDPSIKVVVPKPTKSRANYTQQIGRGTRPEDGLFENDPLCLTDPDYRSNKIIASSKPFLTVVDPVGVCGQHKLITTLDILGGIFTSETKRQAYCDLLAQMTAAQRAKKPLPSQDVLVALRKARQAVMDAEEERKRKVVLRAKFTSRFVDPFDLFDVASTREPGYLRGRIATDKQLEYLQRHTPEGARLPDNLTLHQASELIQGIKNKQAAGPPTERMAACLQKFGYNSEAMTFKDAKATLDQLAANDWQRPAPGEVVPASR